MNPTRSTETSNLGIIEDEAEMAKQAKIILDQIAQIDPAQLQCLMIIAVTNLPPDDPNNHKVDTHIVGSDHDIAKMLTTLAKLARNGITQIESAVPPSPNESRH